MFSEMNRTYKNLLKGFCIILAFLLVVAFVLSFPGGDNSKASAEKFVEALFDADAATMYSFCHSKVIDTALEETGMTKDEFIKKTNEN